MAKWKRQLQKVAALAMSLLLLLGSLVGCGSKPQEDPSGADGPMNTYTPPVNEDGSVNYIFLPEQFETYKTQLYDAGRFQYYFGSFPASIQSAEYPETDDAGIPWKINVYVNKDDYEANLPISSLFATVWPATYLGQYQIFCGVPGDEWAVHVTVKDADTGEVISEHDFPTRDE